MNLQIPLIPIWLVAGLAGLYGAVVIWQFAGKRSVQLSRDKRKLDQVTGSGGEEVLEQREKGLEDELKQAGLDLSPSTFNVLRLAGVGAGLVVGPVMGMPLLIGVALAGLAWFGARWWVRDRIRSRSLRIEKELPSVLSRLASQLDIVTSMPQLLMMVAESLAATNENSPLAAELRQTAAELRDRGEVALTNLEERAPSPALATLAFNLRIYMRAGGEQAQSMADAAKRMQSVIKARNNARAKAGGAMALAKVLPILLAGTTVFTLRDPIVKAFYASAVGQFTILGIAALMIVGYQVMKRMVEGVA